MMPSFTLGDELLALTLLLAAVVFKLLVRKPEEDEKHRGPNGPEGPDGVFRWLTSDERVDEE